MNAGLAVEAQRAGHFKVVLQALSIVDVGKDRVLRGNARRAAGHENGVARIENFPAGLGALGGHAGGEVFRTERHRGYTGARRGDRLCVDDTKIGLDVAPELDAADGQARLFLNGGHLRIDALHLLGVFDLRDADGIGLGTHGGFQVLVELPGVNAVDADEDVLILWALILHRVVDKKTCRILFTRRHGVLKVINKAVFIVKARLDHFDGARPAGVHRGTHQFGFRHSDPPFPSRRTPPPRGRWHTAFSRG